MTRSRSQTSRSRQPSVVALLFTIWALVIPLGYSRGLLSSDGDLARHLVLGRHIPREGPSFADVFSHTRPGETFLAYEWLSEVILALVHWVGGLSAVAVFGALLIAGSVAIVAAYLRHRVETAVVLLAGNLVAVFTYPHWIARPHLFSFLGVAILLVVATRSPGLRRNLALGALFLVWANLHPGFLYGLAILMAFLLGDTLDHRSRERLRTNAASALVALLCTLGNPFGPGLHADIVRHLRDVRAMELIEEFQALEITTPYGFLFFTCLALAILLLSAGKRRPPFSTLLPFLAAVFAALVVVRNVPLFALFALPLLLSSTAEVIREWRWKPLEGPRTVMSADDANARTAPLVVIVLLGLGVLVSLSGRIGPVQVIQDSFSPEEFPVAAVAEAREEGLSDLKMFNEYRWGGFILYAWPEQRIFIDGMANFFGGALMEEYLSIRFGLQGWEERLREREVDLIILPPDVPLVGATRASPDWQVWHEDPGAVVLLRVGSASPAGEAAFPGDALLPREEPPALPDTTAVGPSASGRPTESIPYSGG